MDGHAAQRRIAGPIERCPLDLDRALRRLRRLDPAAVARAVPRPTGPVREAMAELVARLLHRLVLEEAERPAPAIDPPGRARVTRAPGAAPVRR